MRGMSHPLASRPVSQVHRRHKYKHAVSPVDVLRQLPVPRFVWRCWLQGRGQLWELWPPLAVVVRSLVDGAPRGPSRGSGVTGEPASGLPDPTRRPPNAGPVPGPSPSSGSKPLHQLQLEVPHSHSSGPGPAGSGPVPSPSPAPSLNPSPVPAQARSQLRPDHTRSPGSGKTHNNFGQQPVSSGVFNKECLNSRYE